MMMRKGENTKQVILDHAMKLASGLGLEGLSIGRLADDLSLSKSGLFAHFKSKESLQIETLSNAAAKFSQRVVRPAISEPRGKKRIHGLFENWLAWGHSQKTGHGCIFMAAAFELDDQPGPVRDHLVLLQKQWIEVIQRVAQTGVSERYLRLNLDIEQFAYDFYSMGPAYQYFSRLMRDPKAEEKVRKSFERLIRDSEKGKRK